MDNTTIFLVIAGVYGGSAVIGYLKASLREEKLKAELAEVERKLQRYIDHYGPFPHPDVREGKS